MGQKNTGLGYAVVIEATDTGYSAYVPDLPGCVAVGDTFEETRLLIEEAVGLHIEGLKLDGAEVPEPTSRCEYVRAGS